MAMQILTARPHDLGGFEVARVLPHAARRMVGPFVFLDHMGPADMAAPIPRSTDVRPHPHIGLSTVSWLFDGSLTHRDSLGVSQDIQPGELNWMTAGRGITHSERFDRMRESGGHMDGMQAWVALPEAHEEDPPSFQHVEATDLPRIEGAGVTIVLIAGDGMGLVSPVRVHSPLCYAEVSLTDRAEWILPNDYPERAVYVARGSMECDGQELSRGQMLVADQGTEVVLRAKGDVRLMLLAGEPLGQRYVWWNFVSSRRDRIEQAKADWQAGRMPLPADDAEEWIPLPESIPDASANPMS